ncbi:MAG: hypothetical protein NC082_05960 [Clostridiales bacterium]|nr:hypothetical protein [Clostridiales bacterium]
MNVREELNLEFSKQPCYTEEADDAILERYVRIAEGYAEIEGSVGCTQRLAH